MTAVYLITFVFGYGMWKFTVPVVGWTSGQMFEIVMYGKLNRVAFGNNS